MFFVCELFPFLTHPPTQLRINPLFLTLPFVASDIILSTLKKNITDFSWLKNYMNDTVSPNSPTDTDTNML